MTKKQALAIAKSEYSQYNIVVKTNCVDVRDSESNLVTRIYFVEPVQLQLGF